MGVDEDDNVDPQDILQTTNDSSLGQAHYTQLNSWVAVGTIIDYY